MDKKKLGKIRKKTAALRLRSNNIRSIDLIKIAKSLGRKIANRGHEPNYISVFLPRSRPISIPNHPGANLIKIAKSLGRKIANRGHEPNYISVFLPRSRPISIPNHPGAMARFTAENILDQLEQDIFYIEESIERQDI